MWNGQNQDSVYVTNQYFAYSNIQMIIQEMQRNN